MTEKATELLNALEDVLVIHVKDLMQRSNNPVSDEQARNVIANVGNNIQIKKLKSEI